MKRISYILLGFVVGVVFMISAGAYAASTGMIGKKITSAVPIVLDGKKLSETGAVADGTTLLPVRSLAGLFKADVSYTNGTVYLTSPKEGEAIVPEQQVTETTQSSKEQIEQQISDLESRITTAKANYDEMQNMIDRLSTDPTATQLLEVTKKNNELNKTAIEKLEAEKADLETQLQALQKQ